MKGLIMISVVLALAANCFGGDEPKKNGGDPRFSPAFIDTTVSLSADFYDYAVGNWLKGNPIPDEQSRWGTFELLQESNYKDLQEILEETSARKDADTKSPEYQTGAFYLSGMNEGILNKQGFKPLQPYLDKIETITSREALIDVLAYFHKHRLSVLFHFGSEPDAKNSSMEIASLSQGGLGLPDRDYYLNDDERSQEIRACYVEHITKMFILLGIDPLEAKQQADIILDFEIKLAHVSMSRLEMRDPVKTYHKYSFEDLKSGMLNFDWQRYFDGIGLSNPGDVNLSQQTFFFNMVTLTLVAPFETWKSYLRWSMLRLTANYLSAPFVEERFAFTGTFLNGQKAMQPRWKRVLNVINSNIGEALGKLYVERHFPPEAKQRALLIVDNLLAAMKERILGLEWMSEETKKQAIGKLATFIVKIGYPDTWEDYSSIIITPDNYLQNVLNCGVYSFNKMLGKIGKPVDRAEWGMNPQTVNAYYNPLLNEIVFPAAILQPPFFDLDADDALNYGAMGAVIGHEVTHGFDDEGRKYDEKGNLNEWWTEADAAEFMKRANILVEQYSSYAPVDTFSINGELTLGENIADLGGLTVSYAAFKRTAQFQGGEKIDGLTPQQRFFFSWANVWKNNIREQALKLRLKTDPHSPGKYRVIGPFANMPEFIEAFSVPAGSPMARPESTRVKIW